MKDGAWLGAAGLIACTALTFNACSSDNSTTTPILSAEAGAIEGGAPPTGCDAGAKMCVTSSTAAVCASDGSGWIGVACGDGEGCVNGECAADPNAKCVAGSGSCLNGTTALRCKANSIGLEQVNCPTGTACVGEGVCQGACTVGSSECLATGAVATCADGKSFTPTACNAGELCVAVSDKPWPQAACKPAACKPRTDGCDWSCGNKNDSNVDQTKFRSRCVATPSGYEWVAEGCLDPTTCDPKGASCTAGSQAACKSECTPGSSRCNADKTGMQTCGTDGKWSASITACNPTTATGYVCMTAPDDSSNVVCGDPLCAGGAAGTCDAGGGFKACGHDGRIASAPTACSTGTCIASGNPVAGVIAGACQTQCQAGDERCIDLMSNSNAFQTCSNGLWSSPQTCASLGDGGIGACFGYTTTLGRPAKLCGGVCAPGTSQCVGADAGVGAQIRTCNANGQWDASVACAVGACQTGGGLGARCVADCIPNETFCTGTSKAVAGTGFTGTDAFGVCTSQGLRATSTTSCTGDTVCRRNLQGNAVVVNGNACLECVGPGVAGGNEAGQTDQRCADALGDAGTEATQLCGSANTWTGAITSCANSTCSTSNTVGAVCGASAATFSQVFTNGVAAVPVQCQAWDVFRSRLSAGATYSSITLKGSQNPVGRTCTGAAANQLCQAIRNDVTLGAVSCGGSTWSYGGCATYKELSASGVCSCTDNYVVRACISTAQWGGIGGADSCTAPTQTITVICQ